MSKVNTEPGHDARSALECAIIIVDHLSRNKKLEVAGEMNELFLFLEKCIRDAKKEETK